MQKWVRPSYVKAIIKTRMGLNFGTRDKGARVVGPSYSKAIKGEDSAHALAS